MDAVQLAILGISARVEMALIVLSPAPGRIEFPSSVSRETIVSVEKALLSCEDIALISPLTSSLEFAHLGGCCMNFIEGKTVIYPHHGPATVAAIADRKIRGESVQYVELAVHDSDLTLSVPVARAEFIGIRKIMNKSAIEKIFELLRSPGEEQETSWARRFKANSGKLKTGDIESYAEVTRDLIRRDAEKSLSYAERELLRYAMKPLIAEVALAMKIDEEQCEATIMEAAGAQETVAA